MGFHVSLGQGNRVGPGSRALLKVRQEGKV